MNILTRETAGDAIRKLRSREALTDMEIKAGIEVLQVLVPCLREFGETYHLVYSSLSRNLDQLRTFNKKQDRPRNLLSFSEDWTMDGTALVADQLSDCGKRKTQSVDWSNPRTFDLCGQKVEEYLLPLVEEGWQKILWCYAPFSSMTKEFLSGEGVNEQIRVVNNVLVHLDFDSSQPNALEEAKIQVYETFKRHHGLED